MDITKQCTNYIAESIILVILVNLGCSEYAALVLHSCFRLPFSGSSAGNDGVVSCYGKREHRIVPRCVLRVLLRLSHTSLYLLFENV